MNYKLIMGESRHRAVIPSALMCSQILQEVTCTLDMSEDDYGGQLTLV